MLITPLEVEAHLRLPGLPEQLASQTDAVLGGGDQCIPVHATVLAMVSPVFAALFKTKASEAAQSKQDKLCIPLLGDSIADVCFAVKYVYQRALCQIANAPGRQLWRSVDSARPIIKFAHKYNMQIILEECDACLSEKAQKVPGGVPVPRLGHTKFETTPYSEIFHSVESTIAWAVLAADCSLSHLLAESELFLASMVVTDLGFWHNHDGAVQSLSKESLLRVMGAAQLNAPVLKDMCTSNPIHDDFPSRDCTFCNCTLIKVESNTSHGDSIQQFIRWQ